MNSIAGNSSLVNQCSPRAQAHRRFGWSACALAHIRYYRLFSKSIGAAFDLLPSCVRSWRDENKLNSFSNSVVARSLVVIALSLQTLVDSVVQTLVCKRSIANVRDDMWEWDEYVVTQFVSCHLINYLSFIPRFSDAETSVGVKLTPWRRLYSASVVADSSVAADSYPISVVR